MRIDCDTCPARQRACGDCMITLLLGPSVGVGAAGRRALATLAAAGLIDQVEPLSSVLSTVPTAPADSPAVRLVSRDRVAS